jgi:hypothetical protein
MRTRRATGRSAAVSSEIRRIKQIWNCCVADAVPVHDGADRFWFELENNGAKSATSENYSVVKLAEGNWLCQ